ncbi:hypothetical protein Ancab_021749 [Ancistrocladus abbreviatus]
MDGVVLVEETAPKKSMVSDNGGAVAEVMLLLDFGKSDAGKWSPRVADKRKGRKSEEAEIEWSAFVLLKCVPRVFNFGLLADVLYEGHDGTCLLTLEAKLMSGILLSGVVGLLLQVFSCYGMDGVVLVEETAPKKSMVSDNGGAVAEVMLLLDFGKSDAGKWSPRVADKRKGRKSEEAEIEWSAFVLLKCVPRVFNFGLLADVLYEGHDGTCLLTLEAKLMSGILLSGVVGLLLQVFSCYGMDGVVLVEETAPKKSMVSDNGGAVAEVMLLLDFGKSDAGKWSPRVADKRKGRCAVALVSACPVKGPDQQTTSVGGRQVSPFCGLGGALGLLADVLYEGHDGTCLLTLEAKLMSGILLSGVVGLLLQVFSCYGMDGVVLVEETAPKKSMVSDNGGAVAEVMLLLDFGKSDAGKWSPRVADKRKGR